ncbi:MAG TPA: hypothetical protein PLT82_06215 [Candidatus Hydrogenedens sp.]|nr:hypothetical protein [Candidatus Hydrogenedens sp.]HOL20366.1 hypothetical protein [Candidatus Hydrogenedens sp.]HPP58709.1 hypothetical protein [Candidatus Hydrogenedens sp.]
MRKLSFAALLILLGTGVAFASSLAIPWFADNAPQYNGLPGKASGATNLVYLKSNVDTTVTCYITYYNADGVCLGPFPPNNSFTIAPRSALAFRPCVYDPDATAGGQHGGMEGGQGVLVPDRPLSPDNSTPIPGVGIVDTKTNGSATIEWIGGPNDIQGANTNFVTVVNPDGSKVTLSYGHLLPPGI